MDDCGGRSRRLRVDGLVGDRREAQRAVGRQEDGLRAGVQHAVAALELGTVDGEVGLVNELVRVGAVRRAPGHAERDGGVDRLARRLHLEPLVGDGAADPLGDLEGLLRSRLGEDDRELLAAEARGDVGVAQLPLEDAGDAVQDRVARQVPVGVVDLAKQVEVGHDHRQRRARALRAIELLPERGGEVARVEEPRLRVDARLLLQGRDAERAVDEQERRHGHRQEQRIPVPEPGEGDAQHREHEVGGKALHGEQPGAAERVPARQVEHGGQERVVERDEDDRRCQARQRELELRAQPGVADQLDRPPRREPVQRVVRDVERLDVPGVADLQPFGDAVDDAEERDQLRRQEQHAGDEEDDRRVVALVPRRPDDEELRARGARRQDEEGHPAVGVEREVGEGDYRRRGRQSADGVEKRLRARLQRGRLGRIRVDRGLPVRELARDRAHSRRTGSRNAHANGRYGRRAMC